MEHLTFEQKLSYITELCNDDQLFHIEVHLANCQPCAQSVGNLLNIQNSFNQYWYRWLIDSRQRRSIKESLLEILTSATVPAHRIDTLKDWFSRLFNRTGSVFSFYLDQAKNTMEKVDDLIEEIITPQFILSPVARPVRVRGKTLEKMEIYECQKPDVNLLLLPEERKVVVKTELLPKPRPTVILIEWLSKQIFSEELQQPEGADYLVAEFRNLTQGKYLFLMEKVERKA